MKKTVSASITLQKRLEFSRKSLSCLGLLTTASVFSHYVHGADIDFIDENMESIDIGARLEQGYDLVAIGGTVFQMNRMVSLISAALRKDVAVVVGGAAAMTFPDIFKRKGVSLILGESEVFVQDFIKDFEKGIPKSVYKASSGPGFDLSCCLTPDFSLISGYDYTFVGVQTTRGCPVGCEFCQVSNWLGTKYRHKDVDQVIHEIKIVKSLWPDAFFFFYDDNLFADLRYSKKLFKKILSEDIDLGRWGANADPSIYRQDELLELMTSAGFLDYLGMGFESLSYESLKTIGNSKKAGLQKSYDFIVEKLSKKKIGVFGYFMFGFENSRAQDIKAIVDFIISHNINGQISQLIPMPGTLLYERLVLEYEKKFGKIKKGSVGRWNVIRKFLTDKAGISKTEVITLISQAYTQIYDDSRMQYKRLLPAPFI